NNFHVNATRNTAVRNTAVVNDRRQLNNVVAGRDNRVYRPAGGGAWETHTGAGWNRVDPGRLPADRQGPLTPGDPGLAARRTGEANYRATHGAVRPAPVTARPQVGGNAGFHGGAGGFRGGGGRGGRR